jgi:hypothetical protein
MRHLSALLALGCGQPPEPAEIVFAPTAEQQAMIRALSHRDGGPDCATVEALAADPVPALVGLVDHVYNPPMVPMRAAGCLLERHAAEVEPHIVRWVTAEETRGLALLAAGSLDRMESEVAVRVARAALAGPHAAQVRGRIAAASDPAVRALVGVTP